MSPGDEVFSDADLEPTPEERRRARRGSVELGATLVALAAVGLWAGTIVAERWCAAPALTAGLPESVAHGVLLGVQARSDELGLGAAVAVLAAEIVRTLSASDRPGALGPRLRRMLGVVAAAIAAYLALGLTPTATRAEQAGAVPGAGPAGAELRSLEERGRQLRLGELGLLGLLFGLQLGTLRGRHVPDPAEDEADSPLPPGPDPKAPA